MWVILYKFMQIKKRMSSVFVEFFYIVPTFYFMRPAENHISSEQDFHQKLFVWNHTVWDRFHIFQLRQRARRQYFIFMALPHPALWVSALICQCAIRIVSRCSINTTIRIFNQNCFCHCRHTRNISLQYPTGLVVGFP